jgi:hypothetical protein
MKKLSILLVPALIALSTLPCLAADSPFAGKWKLDPAKSTFTGGTFTYSTTPSGLMHYSDGAAEWDFGIDGKPYPTFPNRTTTWTKINDHTWENVIKIGDKVSGKGHRELSTDGKTLTARYTLFRPDGGSEQTDETYTRVGGGPGLAGTWKNTKTQVPSDSISIAMPSAGHIVYTDINFQTIIDGPTDGSPIPIKGPQVPEGFVAMYKASAPDKLEYTIKVNDKAINMGVMTVSGNTLTDTSWTPGKENEKTIAVYNRQ